MADIFPSILVAVKRKREEEHLGINFVNKRLTFQEKKLIE